MSAGLFRVLQDRRTHEAAQRGESPSIYVSPRNEAVFVQNGPRRGDWGDRDWTALFYSVAERL